MIVVKITSSEENLDLSVPFHVLQFLDQFLVILFVLDDSSVKEIKVVTEFFLKRMFIGIVHKNGFALKK